MWRHLRYSKIVRYIEIVRYSEIRTWRSRALLRSAAAWLPVMGCWAAGSCSMYLTANWLSADGGTQSSGLEGPPSTSKTCAPWLLKSSVAGRLAVGALAFFSVSSRRTSRLEGSSSSVTKWFSLPQRQLRQIFLLGHQFWSVKISRDCLLTITSSNGDRIRSISAHIECTAIRRLARGRFSVAVKWNFTYQLNLNKFNCKPVEFYSPNWEDSFLVGRPWHIHWDSK